MGPKISRGKAQSGSTDTPDSIRQSQWTDTPADAENVEWDGSLIDKARWFFNLLDALPEDSKFFRLIETATVLTDKQAKIAVFHPDHARIHLERSDAPGSIDAPCMYMRNSFGPITSAASAMASPGAPPIPPSLSAMAPAEEEPAEEGEEAAPAPAPSALDAMATISAQIAALATSASPTTTTPSALSRALGPDYAAMYTIAPHVIETTDEELAAYFLNRIGPQSVRKDYRAKANRSGRRFIVVFLEELKRAAVSSSTSTTIAERMRLLLEAGCEPSVAAWLRLTEVHSSWNRAMPPDQIIPAQQLAVMYKNVIVLCRAMSKPSPQLMVAAEHVLAYLYRNRDIGLRYKADEKPLEGFTDSDWGVRHSTSGYVFMLNHACISWASKKQSSVALSSCEAEIMAASEAAKEAVYLGSFLGELDAHDDSPVDLYLDNKAAGDLAYNPEHHPKTKHIARRHFYVRECVEEHKLRVPFVASHDNLADFFTKPLNAKTRGKYGPV